MTKMMYRGVAYETGQKPVQTLADQMKRPVLTYRGVEHDGEKPVQTAVDRDVPLFYRGHRYA